MPAWRWKITEGPPGASYPSTGEAPPKNCQSEYDLVPAVIMSKLRFLLSVTNDDNDFQIEQVKTARQAAGKAGVDLEILFAGDDGIRQSQQLLDKIQSPVDLRPNAILLEPAGSTVFSPTIPTTSETKRQEKKFAVARAYV